MDKKTKLVLDLLKTKASSLGFNKEELEGAAATIAGNLGIDDDVTDEVMNAAAEKAVAVYIPILELSQKNANRIIQKNKEEREKAEAEAKKAAEEAAAKKAEEERKAKEEAERKAKEEEERKKAEEEGLQKFLDSEWARNMKTENENLAKQLKAQQEASKKQLEEFNAFRTEFNTMKAERIKNEREKQLGAVLEGSGRFGDRIKQNYALMTFNTDEEFNTFLDGVKDDIKAINQERANQGLERLGTPGKGEDVDTTKVEPMTDEEIDSLAAIM